MKFPLLRTDTHHPSHDDIEEAVQTASARVASATCSSPVLHVLHVLVLVVVVPRRLPRRVGFVQRMGQLNLRGELGGIQGSRKRLTQATGL